MFFRTIENCNCQPIPAYEAIHWIYRDDAKEIYITLCEECVPHWTEILRRGV